MSWSGFSRKQSFKSTRKVVTTFVILEDDLEESVVVPAVQRARLR